MNNKRPLKLLILCWGFSIHARRRAELFIEDERFDVAVASTYNYCFEDAQNIILRAKNRGVISGDKKPNVPKGRLSKIPMPIRMFLKSILNVIGLGPELIGMYRDFRALRKFSAEFSPDVVLLQTLQYPSFLAYLLPAKLPIAVTFWNGDLTYFAKWTGLEVLFKKALVKYGLKRVDAITVNSQTALEAGVSLGAEREKFSLIRYPGANLEAFHAKSKGEARRKLNLSSDKVILCPRGLGIFFNSDVIVHAAAQVAKIFPDTVLLFISGVGGQAEWDKHLKLAKDLDLSLEMRWDGDIAWEDMPDYYSAADLMVSVKTEDSCPNCMLEAMACETPVVMSDTSQNREWIEDEGNGFLISPRDVDALANRIIRTLENDENIIEAFTKVSLDKVKLGADSKINIAKIKETILSLNPRDGV